MSFNRMTHRFHARITRPTNNLGNCVINDLENHKKKKKLKEENINNKKKQRERKNQ